MTQDGETAERFRYDAYETDPDRGRLSCHYSLGGRRFTEEITFAPGGRWDTPAADAAARLVFLLAGVSYYKTRAPAVVDLGELASTAAERAFLRTFYVEGLGEFAFRNGLDLGGLEVVGPDRPGEGPTPYHPDPGRPLVPFGGGIDSIVSAEVVRRHHPDTSLFVVSRPGDRFEAIERPAAVSGLPVVRAERAIDPVLLGGGEPGFLNGHVPVTGIISAVAVMAAVLGGHDAVVMSNEWSASAPTLEVGGRSVNHQWSKSMAFERLFRETLAGTLGPALRYYSLLRPYSELWVARRFAALSGYHRAFRSCNRAFTIDPARRLDHWCGTCDKCCFIDLILSPFLAPGDLAAVFGGREPLADASLRDRFTALLGTGTAAKPFECVGDVGECRAALALAAARPDRAGTALLQSLARDLDDRGTGEGGADPDRLLRAMGEHFIPPDDRPTDDPAPAAPLV